MRPASSGKIAFRAHKLPPPRIALSRGLSWLLAYGLDPPLQPHWRKAVLQLFEQYWDHAISLDVLFHSFALLTDPAGELDEDYYYLWFLTHFRDFLDNIAAETLDHLEFLAIRAFEDDEAE
jgi:hypothetical protein